jgi:hypothetical protein
MVRTRNFQTDLVDANRNCESHLDITLLHLRLPTISIVPDVTFANLLFPSPLLASTRQSNPFGYLIDVDIGAFIHTSFLYATNSWGNIS